MAFGDLQLPQKLSFYFTPNEDHCVCDVFHCTSFLGFNALIRTPRKSRVEIELLLHFVHITFATNLDKRNIPSRSAMVNHYFFRLNIACHILIH